MADIKIREVTRGSIKTLDRTSSYMHHIKEAQIRTKDLSAFKDSKDDPTDYAQNKVEHFAGDNAVYAVQAGTEMVLRSRGTNNTDVSQTSELPLRTARGHTEPAVVLQQKREYAGKYLRERNVRNGRNRMERVMAADAKGPGDPGKQNEIYRSIKGRRGRNSRSIQKQQKEHAISKLRNGNAKNGSLLQAGFTGLSSANMPVRKQRGFREMMDKSTAMLSHFAVRVSAAIIAIIVVILFFGAAFSFTEDGHFVEGTGDNTIVEVAKGEIGNTGGKKYWKWYGFNSRVDWCAVFCSWCADQCGSLGDGTLPKFALVGNGANWFKARHRWSGRGYTPKPGDFIFFDYDQNGFLDHVGIVENCNGNIVTTIEGNSGDACERNRYVKGSLSIAGYGLSINKSIASVEDSYWMMSGPLIQKELEACRMQSIWMKDAIYDWEKNPTIEKSKRRGSCVTYVACVLQRMGYLSSGECIWHTGSGFGTGKVYGTTDKMTTIYMDNKPLKSLKNKLYPGDIVLLDDNRKGIGGSGGHIFIVTGEWSGDDPVIWDNETAWKGQKPRAYNGDRKVLAVVRLK